MEENAELEAVSLPEETVEETAAEGTDTIPETSENEILIPVKFNKQVKNLTAEEASGFAQKGMKYDMISGDYERIRQLAAGSGESVGDFLSALERQRTEKRKNELLEKCAGDETFAEHIMALETAACDPLPDGFDELTENFPEIKDLSDLPEQVVERANLRGTSLFDEYLRYQLRCHREAEQAAKQQKQSGTASVGSQKQSAGDINPVDTEFLKGLWGM